MYGSPDTDELVDEDAPLRPLTPYAESKVRAEEANPRARRAPTFAPVSMRNATAYGVSPRLRLDIVLNNLVAWAHTTGAIRLQSDGTRLAPARAHPRHREDDARAARRSRRRDSRRGVQHRLCGAELPHPHARGDRPRAPAPVRGRVRRRRVRRRPQLPRRLLEARGNVSRTTSSSGRRSEARTSSPPRTKLSGSPRPS